MSRITNPAGYVHYDSEDELKQQLEKYFFPSFFDPGWKPILDITKEVYPKYNYGDRIDYYGTRNEKDTWVEVKNWWVRQSDIKQIGRYEKNLTSPYDLFVICGGIELKRSAFLENFGIKIIITKDIKELNPKELIHWA